LRAALGQLALKIRDVGFLPQSELRRRSKRLDLDDDV
jgi:hypothetical protein